MAKYFILFLVLAAILSCDIKSQSTIENILDNFSFNTTLSNSTQIVIKAYDSSVTYKRSGSIELFKPVKVFKTKNNQQIDDFETIFENAEKTGYCCCPISSYSVHFLNKEELLGLFYVDTLQFKDKVRIYEGSFQYSYIIEKQKWKDYLNEIQN